MPFENLPADSASIAVPGESAALGSAGGRGALGALNDSLLVEQARKGERGAFEELVHRYDREVLSLALKILRSPEDARDVYQESFLKIYRNLHRFRSDSSFYTWIYRIVTNVCLDHLRRRRSHPEDQAPVTSREESGEDFFDRQQNASAQIDPERSLWGQELGRHIDGAMEALSPRERIVFEMKHYQGLRLRAIGEALGTTEETVKNSLFRATRKLRAQLEGLR